VKKVLSELANIAANKKDEYLKFIEQFNRPLKEGLYSDFANREALLDLIRVKSTKVEGFTSLAEAKDRMQADQKALYFLTGAKEAQLRNSPLLEIYKKKDIEVLLLDEEIDEIVFGGVDKYKDIDFKAINKSGAGDDLKAETDKAKEEELKPLVETIKKHLGDAVKEVKASSRLADSPSCIVSDDEDPSMQMYTMMKAMGQTAGLPALKPILEVNPDHDIVKKLLASKDESLVADASWLLLDQALLVGGVALDDPAAFVKRLNRVMAKAV